MDAGTLVFNGVLNSNGNVAIDALKSQIRTTIDSNGTEIWSFVGSGMGLPSYSEDDPLVALDVREDQSPCCLIFDGTDDHISTATDWIDAEVRLRLRLQFFVFLAKNEDGSYPLIQPIRRNMMRATLRKLRFSSIDNPNAWRDPTLILGQYPYWIDSPQTAPANYIDDLNNFFPNYPIQPPWWTWHLNIAMHCTNV